MQYYSLEIQGYQKYMEIVRITVALRSRSGGTGK
jgi:hypothetical protein